MVAFHITVDQTAGVGNGGEATPIWFGRRVWVVNVEVVDEEQERLAASLCPAQGGDVYVSSEFAFRRAFVIQDFPQTVEIEEKPIQ